MEAMKQPRTVLATALAIVASLGLAACGSSSSTPVAQTSSASSSSAPAATSAAGSSAAATASGPAPASAPATATSKAAPSGPTVTIKVQAWKGGGAEPANVAAVNAAFEKANPDIKVKFEYVPSGPTYAQKLQPELLAGSGPDVMMTDATTVKTWGKSGYLTDLSADPLSAAIQPAAKPFATYQGKVLAAPMELIGIGLYANMNLLNKAGVTTVPTTWPDFMAALTKIKAAGIKPFTLGQKYGWTANLISQSAASTLVYQKDPEWDAAFLSGKKTFADWSSSVSQLTELEKAGFVNWKDELGVDEFANTDFTAGKSAFWFQGAWNVTAVEKGGFPVQFAPWPAGPAGSSPSALYFSGTMWSGNAHSKNAAAAQKYIDFWTQPANLALYLAAEAAVSPYVGGSNPANPATTSFVSAFTSGHYRLLASNTWETGDADTLIASALQNLLLGKASLTSTLNTIQSGVYKKS
jgi:raffinose/stachyose/melibiose transport system substrate-binding protein